MPLSSPRLRRLVALVAVLAPGRIRRWMFVRLLGHSVHPTARIGRSLIDVDHLVLERDAVIGHLNLIRGCELVHLGRDAMISSLNWVNSVRRQKDYFVLRPDRRPELVLGEGALITVLHLLDCADRIELEPFAVIAGFNSLIQTHAVDFDAVAQSCEPVRIGHHSLISSRCTLLPGSVVPAASIVASGAVVRGELRHPSLFGGVPAKAVRPLDPEGPFFVRQTSHVR